MDIDQIITKARRIKKALLMQWLLPAPMKEAVEVSSVGSQSRLVWEMEVSAEIRKMKASQKDGVGG